MLGREYTILGTVKAGRTARPQTRISDREPERAQRAISAQWRLRGRGEIGRCDFSRSREPRLTVRPLPRGAPERLLELHLFDLDRDIYGEDVEVRFLRYLRPEQKFESVDALAAQIARDVARGARRSSPESAADSRSA